MSAARGGCVTLGEALVRLSVSDGCTLATTDSLELLVGGAEANVAVGVARLGHPATWLSCVSRDPLGRRVVAELRAHGVDCSHVRWVDGARTGVYFTEVAPPPRGVSVTYDRKGSAAAAMTPESIDFGPVTNAGVAQVSGITPALGASSAATASAFVDEARRAKTHVVLDVNYRAKLWAPDTAARILAPLCDRADVVVCTWEDARDVFGIDTAAGATAAELARRFDLEAAIVTAGADGVWLARGGDAEMLPAIPTTTIDRVGAGDAFCAGVVVGLLEGDLRAGVRLGQAAASLKHTMRGDQYVGSRADADALLGPPGRSVGR